MKIALYIRVSTLEQAESGYSISEQKDKLTKWRSQYFRRSRSCWSIIQSAGLRWPV